MWQVTIDAVELRRVALDIEIIGVCGNLGLKQGLLRMEILVKELCSAQERRRKRCRDVKRLDAEGREENGSNFAGRLRREVGTRLE